jgi:hypothetical protein
MGTLKYDGTSVDFDDIVLAHLEIVIVQKLRRQETFLMTWQEPKESGGGRTGIWIHPTAMMTFHFATGDKPDIDRAWLQTLMDSANSLMGMFVSDVGGEAVHPSDANTPV